MEVPLEADQGSLQDLKSCWRCSRLLHPILERVGGATHLPKPLMHFCTAKNHPLQVPVNHSAQRYLLQDSKPLRGGSDFTFGIRQ